DALNNIDALDRVADQDKLVILQERKARHRYRAETRALISHEHELVRLTAEATQTAAGLEAARAQRATYLASLENQRRANAATISALLEQAQTVEARTRQLAAAAAARPGGGLPGRVVGGAMTVTATGYALHGHTATGAPT